MSGLCQALIEAGFKRMLVNGNLDCRKDLGLTGNPLCCLFERLYGGTLSLDLTFASWFILLLV